MANFHSSSSIHFGLLTTDYPYQQASHNLSPSVEWVERRFFLLFLFSKMCWHSSLNSHISQQHLTAQVHLLPFWNRLPRSPLWNCVNSIVQPLNSISLIQPRWSTWGTRVNAPLSESWKLCTRYIYIMWNFIQIHKKLRGGHWCEFLNVVYTTA